MKSDDKISYSNNKRQIRVIKPEYIPQIKREIQQLMRK